MKNIQIKKLIRKKYIYIKLFVLLGIFSFFHYNTSLLTRKKTNSNNFDFQNNLQSQNNLKKKTSYIDVDNLFPPYEKNIDFYHNRTDIKVIAFYSPYFHAIRNELCNYFNEVTNAKKVKKLFYEQRQPRKPSDEKEYIDYHNMNDEEIFEKQIKLAKSHGLYGFAIYYYWFSGHILFKNTLDNFLKYNKMNFPFLLIWKNFNKTKIYDYIEKEPLKDFNEKIDSEKFIESIKKYIEDSRYIKINGKPVIGIYDYLNIKNITNTIKIWRKNSLKYKIGEIYILINLNNNNNNSNIEKIRNLKLFDGAYDFPPNNNIIRNKKPNKFIQIYGTLLYKNIEFNNINFKNITNDFPIFRGSMLEYDNTPMNEKKGIVFIDFSPEIYYLLNRILISWTRHYYNETNRFLFVKSWNEWNEGNYLEPDEKYGYSSINALSKALFNITFNENKYNISNLILSSKIAIQAHIFFIDLLSEIINKTNNIPVKFDLFITTNSLNKTKIINRSLKNYSKANKYEIKIVENKGRDVIPFLNQMKNIIKKYKYICHIHSKASKFNQKLGFFWRNYLYNNLLGNRTIISEILTQFENNEKLGFIYPENYYEVALLLNVKISFDLNRKQMNYILEKIFHKRYKIGHFLDFPAGNMFWAKVLAIYQLFFLDINDKVPKEKGQRDQTIMHGIERIWLFLVKLNGYYYQKMFKCY